MAPRRRQTPPLRAAKLNGDAVDDSSRLQILLEDYSEGRDDERNWNVVLATLIAVAFTLIGLLVAAITQTCRFNTSKSCINVPDYLVGAAPLLPVALLTYAQTLGTVTTFRSFYLRDREEEIREYAKAPLKKLSPIRPVSYEDMVMEVTSLRRGRLQYRLMTFLIITIIIVAFGGFTCYIGLHMDSITQAVMIVSMRRYIVDGRTITRRVLAAGGCFMEWRSVTLSTSVRDRVRTPGLGDRTVPRQTE